MNSQTNFQPFIQTDLEEAKAQEIAKLQNSVENLQKKVDETNGLLVKEKEAARKAIEEAPPVIKETQVFVEDTKKVESLTAEVENLKVRAYMSLYSKNNCYYYNSYYS